MAYMRFVTALAGLAFMTAGTAAAGQSNAPAKAPAVQRSPLAVRMTPDLTVNLSRVVRPTFQLTAGYIPRCFGFMRWATSTRSTWACGRGRA